MLRIELEDHHGESAVQVARCLEVFPANWIDPDGEIVETTCLFVDGGNLGCVRQYKKIVATSTSIRHHLLPVPIPAPSEPIEAKQVASENPEIKLKDNYEF